MTDRGRGKSVGDADASMKRVRGPYETWSYYEDDVILQLLAEEARKGSRLGSGEWGKETWSRVLKAFTDKGFSWDSVAKKLVVEENAWKEYVAKHKDADTFKYQVCQNYELLQVVVGECLATGSCTLTAGNQEEAKSENLASGNLLLLPNEAVEDPIGFESIVETSGHEMGAEGSGMEGMSKGRKRRGFEMGTEGSWMDGIGNESKRQDQEIGAEASGMEGTSTGSKHRYETPTSSRRKHRARDTEDRDRAIISLITELSTAINNLAGNRAEASCWYEALMEVPALDKILRYRAPELLDTDEKKIAFCKTPPEERKDYLEFLWEQKCQQTPFLRNNS
ncbi:uncharacterized protein At2g29880-like isoform X2 [Aristolochia californica]|uniref:uncharacterized protein At2g29880-like isoform X2 n=1 Tax=Aristolochia californica TaxID=171875 RepID=UPI0035D7E6FD